MSATVLRGDARHLPLPDASVDLVITSPPYWSLRSYTDGGEYYGGQIGSEPTPREYIVALLECTAEWMRVLKPSGSLFVNLGDKYATRYSSVRGGGRAGLNDDDDRRGRSGQNHTGAPEKSLLGLPWRYALGCVDNLGLILRAEVIWSKPNGLPESVQDRVRRAHEQVFHLVKQPRYYSAVDEIREAVQTDSHSLSRRERTDRRLAAANGGQVSAVNPLGKLPGSVWEIASAPLVVPPELGIDHFAAYPPELVRRIVLGWSPRPGVVLDPFGGTGTTALVADAYGRAGITVDKSADYCRLAAWRTTDPKQRARVLRPRKRAALQKPRRPWVTDSLFEATP